MTTRGAAGAGFIITPPSRLQRTRSWWLNGSLIHPVKKTPHFAKYLPYPKVSARAVPLRANRHVPDSIPTLRLAIARALAVRLPHCPCCGRLNT